ncbi:MAG: dihydroorotase [Bacteroidaceae bacterium]|nr:dihydroorotase [Bacteroidaceae bacterium]
MTTLIHQATIVNEGEQYIGSVLIKDNCIAAIMRGTETGDITADHIIDAKGQYLIPGCIDDHVHFRDPGLTHKADMHTESRAAARGGITSVMDMPNCNPQTTTIETLEAKFADAKEKCLVNHSFYLGATTDNIEEVRRVDPKTVCGVKLFMGSSTGGMLVDQDERIEAIFSESPNIIALHCEDQNIISANTAKYKEETASDDPDVSYHPLIRSEEACYQSTAKAVVLAKKTGAKIHIMHISTARELELLQQGDIKDKQITAEVCLPHLYYTDADYATYGTRIKCNPAVKSAADRDALRQALRNGLIDVIGTDHAPHLPADKVGGSLKAASGIPTIQYVLPAMLELADEGIITLTEVVEKMAHNPAILYKVKERGFIREGYRADLVLVKPDASHTVSTEEIQSKCAWSPFEGHTFNWDITHTWVNGHAVYANGKFDESVKGERMEFHGEL